MSVDPDLERYLEEFDLASRRLDTRIPLIEEALQELPTCESVQLAGYLGYGRSLLVTDEVREALIASAAKELEVLRKAVQDAREQIIARRTALALI